MGTEILRPQDCLIERIRAPPASLYSRRRNYGYPNPSYSNSNTRPSRRPTVRHEKPDQRRQRAQSEPSMTMSRRSSMSDDSKMMIKRSSSDDMKTVRGCDNNSGLAMEKVMILKRGESLDSMMKKKGPTALEKMTGKCDVYAGSAFSVSPEPSSLPLPSFFKKQISVDDSATRDLKRLLRLEL